VSEQGEEAPAESFATAKLRADVARQQMRLAKDQLKRARKRFKEARREARRARKLADMARRVWKKARRSGKNSVDTKSEGKGATGLAAKRERRGWGRRDDKRARKVSRQPKRSKARRRRSRG